MTDAYQPDIMIYHADCADGFGAAWAVWKKWGNRVQFFPASYGDAPPEVLGKHVLIGDFSYKSDGLASLHGAASVVILDHHKTAEADLALYRRFSEKPHRFTMPVAASMARDLADNGYPPINALFDMDRSGARMVWDFCHPGVEVPLLIRLIEDRDLWRFTFPETKPFGAWLRCEPMTFDAWSAVDDRLCKENGLAEIMAEALAMQRFMDQKVDEIARFARVCHLGGFGGVPVCNCPPMFASEVGHYLLAKYPDAPFSATYCDLKSFRGWSLRSEDGRQDVSFVAKKFGGGGHRNAAGFGVPLP
ncbi:phosphohydrolase [Novosphingobium sp. FSW06-99]|uniref:phosphohydrolase n=1 Tax=Novosphingobium sp. FSW06-99 TaxID=1739113 RepID=UPI000AB9C5A2|nr:phosphohydrolase [Novosphingobium sp. FSW06-99]